MISGSLTLPSRSSSPRRAAWGRLLGLLGLVVLVAACSQGPTAIGVGLPGPDANTGAYLIDTLTVRASTVLRDSVVTSTASTLLLGRYTDPQLGTIQAQSYFGVGLSAPFIPDGSFVFDSLVLTLAPSSGSTAYRYGDTTSTQHLVAVYQLNQPLPATTTKPLFASPKLTPLTGYYDPLTSLLNRNRLVRQRRASPTLPVLRMRLSDALGTTLFSAGQRGLIRTQDQLQAYLPGLAIAPDPADNAALLTFLATSENSGLFIYYHDPTDATTAMNSGFSVASGGPHCFQVQAGRGGAVLGPQLPTQSLQAVSSLALGAQTVIEGGIGLQTRLEFPYLSDLNQLGQHLTITNAQLVAEVPTATLTAGVPPIATLQVASSNLNRQPVALFSGGVNYGTTVSALTTLQQGAYTLPNAVINTYIQAVLANATPNNGLLLASSTPELPTRVILGGPRNQLNKMRLRLYIISTN